MNAELETFARSIRGVVADLELNDEWAPGRFADDRDANLCSALDAVGWSDVTTDPDLTAFVGVGALELGRAATTVHPVMDVLGASPLMGDLAPYAAAGSTAARRLGAEIELFEIVHSTPVAFADSLGVHRVEELGRSHGPADPVAVASWQTGLVGYLAGLSLGVLERMEAHVKEREIYGATLAHLSPIQQRVAAAATVSDALVLTARDGAGSLAALADAAARTWTVMAHGHMAFGAIGYTLEFPLQRFSRRARSLRALSESWIDDALESAA